MFLTSLDDSGVGEKAMEKIRWLTDRFLAGIARQIGKSLVDIKDAPVVRIPLIAGNNDGFRGNFLERLQQLLKDSHARNNRPLQTGRANCDDEGRASWSCMIFSSLPICRRSDKFVSPYMVKHRRTFEKRNRCGIYLYRFAGRRG